MRSLIRSLLPLWLALCAGAAWAGNTTNMLVQPANTIDFGSVAIGQSAVRAVTVTAPATNSMPITNINPGLPSGFTFEPGGTCDGLSSLPPGQSCTFNVRFTPTSSTQSGGLVLATCSTTVQTRFMVAGFTLNCGSQTPSAFAQFVAAAATLTVPVLSPALVTLLVLGLLGFGARSALRRVKR